MCVLDTIQKTYPNQTSAGEKFEFPFGGKRFGSTLHKFPFFEQNFFEQNFFEQNIMHPPMLCSHALQKEGTYSLESQTKV